MASLKTFPRSAAHSVDQASVRLPELNYSARTDARTTRPRSRSTEINASEAGNDAASSDKRSAEWGQSPRQSSQLDANYVDAATIRRRVAKIKNSWDSNTVRARSIEGERRRNELAIMFADLLDEDCIPDASGDGEQSGFGLVG